MNSKASLLATALLSAAAITSLGVPSLRAMPLGFNTPDQATKSYSKVFDDWIEHSMLSVPFEDATSGSLDLTQTSRRDNTCTWLPLSYGGSLQRKAMLPSDRADEASVLGLLAACFDADNPPPTNIIAAVELAEQRGLGTNQAKYHSLGRWPGLQGDPITLTWSFVPDGLVIPAAPVLAGQPVWDNGGAAATSQLFATLNAQFGNTALWISLVQSVFDRWQTLTGIKFVRVQNGANDWDDGAAWGAVGSATRGDIRISLRNIDGPNGILAYCYYPNTGDMVLDSSENWAFGPGNNYVRMRNIIAHELGHGIGLQHACPLSHTKLMEPYIDLVPSFAGPQQDDVRGGERLYGDPYEPNNSAAAAFDLGVLTGSITVGDLPAPPNPDPQIASTSIASIDANGEEDWFKITVPASTLLTATLQPVGSTYDDSAQEINGHCLSGSFINALAVADLTLEVLDSSSVSLGFANATGAGGSETINNLILPAAGTYYVKIAAANTPVQTQLYKLSLTVNSVTLPQTGNPTYTQSTNLSDFITKCSVREYATFTDGSLDQLCFPCIPPSTTLPYTPTTAILSAAKYPRVIGTELTGVAFPLRPVVVQFSKPVSQIVVFPSIDHVGHAWDAYQWDIYGGTLDVNNNIINFVLLFDPISANQSDVDGKDQNFTLKAWAGPAPTLINNAITPGLGGYSANIGYETYFDFGPSAYEYYAFRASTLELSVPSGERETEISAVAEATACIGSSCLSITNLSVACLATNSTYAWSFCVTNTFTNEIAFLSILDLPVGVTVSQDVVPLPKDLNPGDSACLTLYVTNAPGLTNMCFAIGAHSTNFVLCCSITNCLTFPPCCVSFSQETLGVTSAPQGQGCYSYTFTVQNNTVPPVPIQYLLLVPDPVAPNNCITFTPEDIIKFSPPLLPGQAIAKTVKFCITPGCNGPFCFQAAALDTNLVHCCSILHCLPTLAKSALGPLLTSLKCVGSALQFCLPTTAGATYVVESTKSLSPPQWTVQRTIVGDGSTVAVTNAITVAPQQFYRVRLAQ